MLQISPTDDESSTAFLCADGSPGYPSRDRAESTYEVTVGKQKSHGQIEQVMVMHSRTNLELILDIASHGREERLVSGGIWLASKEVEAWMNAFLKLAGAEGTKHVFTRESTHASKFK